MPDIVGAVVGLGFLILWIYCIYDAVTTDESIVRHLPKVAWILIVIFLGDIGSLLWLALGRPRVWTQRAFDARHSPTPTSRPPDANPLDDPSLDRLDPIVRHREEQSRLRLWEAQLQRREEEMKHRYGDPSSD